MSRLYVNDADVTNAEVETFRITGFGVATKIRLPLARPRTWSVALVPPPVCTTFPTRLPFAVVEYWSSIAITPLFPFG
jgi:hypothetical protein